MMSAASTAEPILQEELRDMEEDIFESLDGLLKTTNKVFLLMSVVLFVVCALLIVQIGFSVFNLKLKPTAAPPIKVIIQKKKKRTSSSSKRRGRGSKKLSSRSLKKMTSSKSEPRNYPSKTASLMVDFDNREKEKVDRKDPAPRVPTNQPSGYPSEKSSGSVKQSKRSSENPLDTTLTLDVTQGNITPPTANTNTPQSTQPSNSQAQVANPSNVVPSQSVKPAEVVPAENPKSSYNILSQYMAHPAFAGGVNSVCLPVNDQPVATPKDVKKQ